MTPSDVETRARSSSLGTVALVLVALAIGSAAIALPGALVWLSIQLPVTGAPDGGLLGILANVVTIPAALISWAFACAGALTAGTALIRGPRHPQTNRDRRAALALRLGIPGAALGTIAVVAVVLMLGLSLGIVSGPDDHRRQADADAVAAHLSLPTSGPELVARCEHKNGITGQERWVSVLEPQSESRVDQIQRRLLDYTPVGSFSPTSPTDPQKVYFVGTDTHGNAIRISVDYVATGATLNLGCGAEHIRQPVMLTEIVLQDS